MRDMQPTHSRILLCACPAHCAQILQAAAAACLPLHGLLPHTQWPKAALNTQLLWALLPETPTTTVSNIALQNVKALEASWRHVMLQGGHNFTIHMLYGSAQQQATQLAPWVSEDGTTATDADCWECLDARSEQKLFQHLLLGS